MATPDPYRVLGVPPSADDGAVRAAYLSLMKRYHPDQNRSDEAAGRARDVAAAYALLSDPDRRAEFHRQRLTVEPRTAPPGSAPPPPVRGRAGGLLLVALSAGLVGFAVTRPTLSLPRHHAPAPPRAAAIPVAAVVPLPPPPPPPAPPLVQHATQPARQVVALPLPVALPVARKLAVQPATGQPVVVPPAPLEPKRNACEVEASCPAIDLAALGHHLALLTGQSLRNADPETRALLLGTQATFQARMARCTSAVCKRNAYLARNREIADIMRG